jgi:hypothetical protein
MSQARWNAYCERISDPVLANGLAGFADHSRIEQVTLAAHWTDISFGDESIEVLAASGAPSCYAICWAGEHGIAETELREAYAALVRGLGTDPNGSRDVGH